MKTKNLIFLIIAVLGLAFCVYKLFFTRVEAGPPGVIISVKPGCKVDTCTLDGVDITVSFAFDYGNLRKGTTKEMFGETVGKAIKTIAANTTAEDLISNRERFRDSVVKELGGARIFIEDIMFHQSLVSLDRRLFLTKDAVTMNFGYVAALRQKAIHGEEAFTIKPLIEVKIQEVLMNYRYSDLKSNSEETKKEIEKKVLDALGYDKAKVNYLRISDFTPAP